MQLLDHPSVGPLKNCFYSTTDKNTVFLNIVLEYVPETMLSHYVRMTQHVPTLYVHLYTYQICRWFNYIHNVIGVCHRDIKPQHLLVNPLLHRLKLCDFGSAKMLKPSSPTQASGPIPVTAQQQPLPVFRQPPTGLHLPHYPPNYIPYAPFFSPFYLPPPPMHQFLSNGGFPQQGQSGNMYPSPPGKYPVQHYKPGGNIENSAHGGVLGLVVLVDMVGMGIRVLMKTLVDHSLRRIMFMSHGNRLLNRSRASSGGCQGGSLHP